MQTAREKSKNILETDQVAKYIYEKFGERLITKTGLTKGKHITMFGEHIRRTNNEAFEREKDLVYNRK